MKKQFYERVLQMVADRLNMAWGDFLLFITLLLSVTAVDAQSPLRLSNAILLGRGVDKAFYTHSALPKKRGLLALVETKSSIHPSQANFIESKLRESVINRLLGYNLRRIPVPKTYGIRLIENDLRNTRLLPTRGRAFGYPMTDLSFSGDVVPMVEIERFDGTLHDVMSGKIKLTLPQYHLVQRQVNAIVERMETIRYAGSDMGPANWFIKVRGSNRARVVLGDPDAARVGSEAMKALDDFREYDQVLENLRMTEPLFLIRR